MSKKKKKRQPINRKALLSCLDCGSPPSRVSYGLSRELRELFADLVDFPSHELGETYIFHVSRWQGKETRPTPADPQRCLFRK